MLPTASLKTNRKAAFQPPPSLPLLLLPPRNDDKGSAARAEEDRHMRVRSSLVTSAVVLGLS